MMVRRLEWIEKTNFKVSVCSERDWKALQVSSCTEGAKF